QASNRYQLVDSDPGCNASHVSLDGTVGLAGDMTLGGTALDTDNKPITVTGDLDLSWPLGAPGPVHRSVVVVDELLPIGGTTQILQRWVIIVVGTKARVSRAALTSGHTYIFGVISNLFLPNAASGDF